MLFYVLSFKGISTASPSDNLFAKNQQNFLETKIKLSQNTKKRKQNRSLAEKKAFKKSVFSKQKGWKITSSNIKKLPPKLNLKTGDRVLSINNKNIKNQKQFFKVLNSQFKKKKNLNLKIKRAGKVIAISYADTRVKQKVALAKSKKPSLTKNTLKQAPTQESKKKTLVPEKYKAYMQRAYISSLNSFIYSQPDFDAKQIYPLEIGKHILISRKIFRPAHNFGSFYKIFLFGKEKVIGYVSEAEVIPEFIKKGGAYLPNPNYKKAKRYKSANKVLNLQDIPVVARNEKEKRRAIKKLGSGHRYMGLTSSWVLPFNQLLVYPKQPLENIYIGIKLSGYGAFVSYLNMDVNVASSLNWRAFYADLLFNHKIVQSKNFSVFFMGGLMSRLKLDSNFVLYPDSIDYGLAGALSGFIPLKKNMILRLEVKSFYEIVNKSPSLALTLGLQTNF